MNIELFIAKRISSGAQRSFSKMIVAIAITGIALGLAVMITSFAIVTGFKAEIRDKIIGFSGAIQVVKYDLNTSLENTAVTLKPQAYRLLKNNPDIKHIQAFATKTGIISANGDIEGVVLKGVGTDFDWRFFRNKMVAGNVLKLNSDSSLNEVLISKYTAGKLKLKLNDQVLMYFIQEPLRMRKFRIAGIFDLGIEELDKMFVIGDIKTIQRLNNWNANEVGGYELSLKSYDKLDTISNFVFNNIGDNLTAYSAPERYPAIFDWLSLLDMNAEVILVLMLIVAGINMISALLILILERTNMIGILKALGATSLSVRRIFLYNGTYLILRGMVIGNILGLGFCFLQDKFKIITLDQQSYYMKFVPIEISFFTILLLNIGTLIVCLLMLIVPSMLVARITPIKAIRFK
ncbi:ABC transporter permease [Solitalea koreensis]|uniref:Lipoprotein-releasing system permease protein n=1 Tax=Solitalea koreensis TaxID=543615 RepID=A0A521DY85_9SPHI|nr:FtsX-like permease family protein [Solitalea koreensis]SMO76041.1 lipoprotein-releasing system permease protein [Solitalea koreensis]